MAVSGNDPGRRGSALVRDGNRMRLPFEGAAPLRCVGCGLTYSRAAVAREMTLAIGVACRRCGGELRHDGEERPRRNPVAAVRSPIGGRDRLPVA